MRILEFVSCGRLTVLPEDSPPSRRRMEEAPLPSPRPTEETEAPPLSPMTCAYAEKRRRRSAVPWRPSLVAISEDDMPAATAGVAAKGVGRGGGSRWTERDEERLLRAALEIAEEAAEAFDPSVPLFARLGRALLGSPFTGDEILSKIRELRRRYEEKRYKILVGAAVGDFKVAAFEISNRIWGDGIAGAVTKKRKKKRTFRKFRKFSYRGVDLDALLDMSTDSSSSSSLLELAGGFSAA